MANITQYVENTFHAAYPVSDGYVTGYVRTGQSLHTAVQRGQSAPHPAGQAPLTHVIYLYGHQHRLASTKVARTFRAVTYTDTEEES